MIGYQRQTDQDTGVSSYGSEVQQSGPQQGPGNAARSQQLQGRGPGNGRNPSDYADGDGNQTTHTDVGSGNAVNTPDTPQPTRDMGERELRPLATDAAPLELAGTPTVGDLYEERALTGECEGDWVLVTGILGSPDAPSLLMERDESTIFVDNTPTIDDIHQGYIGDCYFLSALTSITQSDPGHIRDMFTLSGNSVKVRMYSHDAASNSWVERQINVDMNFLHATDGAGAAGEMLASGFRMGETPTNARWYVSAESEDMAWVCSDATYEFALWVPLLEKAYARFAERFGQYGGNYSGDANGRTNDDGSAKSGYEVLEGGWTQYCFGILYGAAEIDNSDLSIVYDAEATDSEQVEANLDFIANLLMVNGTDVPDDQAFYMSLSASSYDITQRLGEQIDHILGLDSVKRHESFQKTLRWVKALCAKFMDAEDNGTEDDVTEAGNKVSEACTRFTEPDAWPILESGRDEGAYTNLRDLAQVAQNIGTDASDGRRLTYSQHAYPVLGVTLRGADGAALGLDTSSLQTRHGEIDADQSSVEFRNPHGTNEPDFDGAGPADGEDDGVFSLALSQVFGVFSLSEQALVQT